MRNQSPDTVPTTGIKAHGHDAKWSAFFRWLALLLWLPLVGCASIANPGPDKVTFNSVPPGAAVSIDGQPVGQTPVTAPVARTAKYVKFSLPGYEEQELPISRQENPWVAGDALMAGGAGTYGGMADSANHNNQMANNEMTARLHHSPPATTRSTNP
jgi:hypothetical protein